MNVVKARYDVRGTVVETAEVQPGAKHRARTDARAKVEATKAYIKAET